jgi:hypothetical protein
MKIAHSIAIYQSVTDLAIRRSVEPIYLRAYRARPAFTALLVGAGMMIAFWSVPAKAEAPKQKAAHSNSMSKVKDNHRIHTRKRQVEHLDERRTGLWI